MSSIPLPALAVKPAEFQDPIANAARVQQIRGMQLGQQTQQLQNQELLQSFATNRSVVAASHDADWNPSDPDSVLKTLSRYNVPLQAQAGVMKDLNSIKTGLNSVSKENLSALDSAHDFIDDQLQSARSAPLDVREKTYQSALGNIGQYASNLAPGMRQQIMQELSGAPPIYDSTWIDMKHGQLKTAAALTKDALEKAQTAEATGRGAQAQAEAGLATARIPGAQAESTIQSQQAGQTPQQRALAGNLFYGAAGGDPQSQQALGLETQQKIAAAQAGVIGAPEALRGVAPRLVLPATADATKADQAFSQAKQAGDEMQSMVQLAKGGNKVAYAYSPVTGVLQINVAGQIKRVNMPEIESYGGAGSAADRIKGYLGKQLSGASIPDNVLNDMATVSQMVTDGASQKYQRDLAGINSRYGSKFTPMDPGAQGAGGHIIDIGGKRYRYNGSGDTADLKNYTAVTR